MRCRNETPAASHQYVLTLTRMNPLHITKHFRKGSTEMFFLYENTSFTQNDDKVTEKIFCSFLRMDLHDAAGLCVCVCVYYKAGINADIFEENGIVRGLRVRWGLNPELFFVFKSTLREARPIRSVDTRPCKLYFFIFTFDIFEFFLIFWSTPSILQKSPKPRPQKADNQWALPLRSVICLKLFNASLRCRVLSTMNPFPV